VVSALDRFFESYYRLRPVNATFTGVHDYDDRLPDWSPEGLGAAADEMQALRRQLAAAGLLTLGDDVLAARDWERIDSALADAFLEVQLAEVESAHFHAGNPSLAVAEAVFGVISLMIRPFADLEARMQRAASRLAAIPLFLAGFERTWTSRVSTTPTAWIERTLRECEGGRKLMTTGIDRWLASDAVSRSLLSDVRRAADTAANALLTFSERVAAREVRNDGYGVGEAFFDMLLARGHCVNRSASKLHETAYRELDIERRLLDDTARAASLGGWRDIQVRLADLHPEPDEFSSKVLTIWIPDRFASARGVINDHSLVAL